MMTISDLSCIGNHNQPMHGTAAMLHRIFSDSKKSIDNDAEMKQYVELIEKLGYANLDE